MMVLLTIILLAQKKFFTINKAYTKFYTLLRSKIKINEIKLDVTLKM